VVPVPTETIGRITALGFNNNLFPTQHTYWETCESWLFMRLNRPCVLERQFLRAPGDGIVVALNTEEDGYLDVEGPPGLIWGFGHVTPAPGLTIGSSVTAGDTIARMFVEHGFDFGVTNFRVEHRYIVPEHYSSQGLHGEHPIAQYPEPIRTELLTRMNPAGPDLGRLSYDSLGTASGGWVLDGSGPVYLTRYTDDLLLFLGRWTERPETRLATFGQPWPGMPNVFLAADASALDWEEITAASGVVAVPLWNLDADARPNPAWPGGTLLLQLIDDLSLRVEWFDTHDAVPGFTPAARLYER
jgi:hypothetical protein